MTSTLLLYDVSQIKSKGASIAAVLFFLSNVSFATKVTVDEDGGADYTSINSVITDMNSSTVSPDTVLITGSDQDAYTISTDMTRTDMGTLVFRSDRTDPDLFPVITHTAGTGHYSLIQVTDVYFENLIISAAGTTVSNAQSVGKTISFNNCIIRDHTSYYFLRMEGGSSNTSLFTNCLFEGNDKIFEIDYWGGSPTIKVVNCTFDTNTEIFNVDIGSSYAANVSIFNCIFSGNTTTYPAGDVFKGKTSYSLTSESVTGYGTGCVSNAGPGYISGTRNNPSDWMIQLSSPGLDIGTLSGAPATDIGGYARSGSPDAGCWEHHPQSDYTWDVSAASGFQAGSGIWGTNDYWSLTGGDGMSLTSWPGAGKTATFGGTDGADFGYTITVSGTQSVDGLTFLNNGYFFQSGTAVNLGTHSGIYVEAGKKVFFETPLSGSAGIIKTGNGILLVAGSCTYTGNTVVSEGAFAIGNGAAAGTVLGNITANDTLYFNRSDNFIFGGNINGTGRLYKNGSGSLTLTGNVTHTGGTYNEGGTGIIIGDGATGGSISGNIFNDFPLTFNRSDAMTYGGVISGTGTVTKQGAGTLTLTGANSYTGLTTISAGTLEIGDGNTSGTIADAGGVADGGVLIFNRSDSFTYGGVVSGTGSVEKKGAGTLTLSGANTYTGATVVSAGTMLVTGTLASTGGVTVAGSAELGGYGTIGGGVTVADGGAVSPGSGGQGKLTTGDLTLNSNSVLNFEAGTYSDTIVVNGDLVLDGTVNITALAGFGLGTYRLMNYTGTLTDNSVTVGSAPGGYVYTITAGSNTVTLTVSPVGVRIWVGGAGNNKWSTINNWSGAGVPTSTDSVVFSSAAYPCSLDVPVAVRCLMFESGYTQSFYLNGKKLTILKDLVMNMSSGSVISNGSDTVVFDGSASGQLWTKASYPWDTLPLVIRQGTGITTVVNQRLHAAGLKITGGELNLGSGLNDTVTGLVQVSGGTLNFSGCTLYAASDVDFRGAGAIVPGSALLKFNGISAQYFYPAFELPHPKIMYSGSNVLHVGGNRLKTGKLTVEYGQVVMDTALYADSLVLMPGITLQLDTALNNRDTILALQTNGDIDFGKTELFVSSALNMNYFSNITGTSRITFFGGNTISFEPKYGYRFNRITKQGSGTVQLSMYSLAADNLLLQDGTWDWGSIINDTIYDTLRIEGGSTTLNSDTVYAGNLVCTGGTLTFGVGTVELFGTGGTVEVSGTAGMIPEYGRVRIKGTGSSLFTLTVSNGQVLPSLYVTGNSLDTVRCLSNIAAKSLHQSSSIMEWGGGLVHVIDTINCTTGKMNFGSSTINVQAGDVNLSGLTGVTAGTGSIVLAGPSGTQYLTPPSGLSLPEISVNGTGTVMISAFPLTCNALSVSNGTFDFGGRDVTVNGNLFFTNGTTSMISGLDGITVTVTGNASFTGLSGNLLNMAPSSVWTLNVTGSLQADYATIGKCTATGAQGQAYINCVDATGNTNWNFILPDTDPPDNPLTLEVTAITTTSLGVKWNPSTVTAVDADSVGLWYKTDMYPTSANDGSFLGKFKLDDSVQVVTVPDAHTLYYIAAAVRDTMENWSAVNNARDTDYTLAVPPTVTTSLGAVNRKKFAITWNNPSGLVPGDSVYIHYDTVSAPGWKRDTAVSYNVVSRDFTLPNTYPDEGTYHIMISTSWDSAGVHHIGDALIDTFVFTVDPPVITTPLTTTGRRAPAINWTNPTGLVAVDSVYLHIDTVTGSNWSLTRTLPASAITVNCTLPAVEGTYKYMLSTTLDSAGLISTENCAIDTVEFVISPPTVTTTFDTTESYTPNVSWTGPAEITTGDYYYVYMDTIGGAWGWTRVDRYACPTGDATLTFTRPGRYIYRVTTSYDSLAAIEPANGALDTITFADTTASSGVDSTVVGTVIVSDTVKPEPLSNVYATAVNCSTAVLSWNRSKSDDADSISLNAAYDGYVSAPQNGTVVKRLSANAGGDTIHGFSASGEFVFIRTFVKDKAGNWSDSDAASSVTVQLPDGEAPRNSLTLTVLSEGDTAVRITIDADETAEPGMTILIGFGLSSQLATDSIRAMRYTDTTVVTSLQVQPGKRYVAGAVTDSAGNRSAVKLDSCTIANTPPVVTIAGDTLAGEDTVWEATVVTSDFNRDSVKIVIDNGPATMALSGTGLRWTPDDADVGPQTIVVSGEDIHGGKSSDTIMVTVINREEPPLLSFTGDSMVYENQSWQAHLVATDPDPSDTTVISVLHKPSWISINGPALSGKPVDRDVGSDTLRCVVTDRTGLADTLVRAVTVVNVNDTPVVVSNTVPDTIFEKTALTATVVVADSDADDTLTLFWVRPCLWITASAPVRDTVLRRWTVALRMTPQQRDTGYATYSVKFTDREGAAVTLSDTIRVLDVNDPPAPPKVSRQVAVGAVQYTVTATDDYDSSLFYAVTLRSMTDTTRFWFDRSTRGKFRFYPLADDRYRLSATVTDQAGLETQPVFDTLVINGASRCIMSDTSWSMVSLPAQYASAKLSQTDYLLHWDESISERQVYHFYLRKDEIPSVEPGKCYWRKGRPSDTVAIAQDQFLRKPVKIALNNKETGWNQIASPYPYPVVWRGKSTVVWKWNPSSGDFEEGDSILEPWAGYWIQSDVSDSVAIDTVPWFTGKSLAKRKKTLFRERRQWICRVVLTTDENTDAENSFGILPGARDGYDRLDRPEPPRLAQGGSLYFPRTGWKRGLTKYASDIRKAWEDINIFEIGMSGTSRSGVAKVRFEGFEESVPLFLFITAGDTIVQVAGDEEITVPLTGSDTYRTLFVVDNAGALKRLPLRFSMGNAYPNPFCPATRINYVLPYRWGKDGKMVTGEYVVCIELFDIMGRKVRTLVHRKMGPGSYQTYWDGKSSSGRIVVSGHYFCRLRADSFESVRKLTLVR